MSAPIRVQLRRTKGWRLPPDTVVVARPTKWGNPFTAVGARLSGTSTAGAVNQFRAWLRGERLPFIRRMAALPDLDGRRAAIIADIDQLRGKNLACWCPLNGEPCHADVLLELANG